ATVTGASIGTGLVETVELVSKTTRSGSLRSEWMRTGGNSVADVSVLGSGACGSTKFEIRSSPTKIPPTYKKYRNKRMLTPLPPRAGTRVNYCAAMTLMALGCPSPLPGSTAQITILRTSGLDPVEGRTDAPSRPKYRLDSSPPRPRGA